MAPRQSGLETVTTDAPRCEIWPSGSMFGTLKMVSSSWALTRIWSSLSGLTVGRGEVVVVVVSALGEDPGFEPSLPMTTTAPTTSARAAAMAPPMIHGVRDLRCGARALG